MRTATADTVIARSGKAGGFVGWVMAWWSVAATPAASFGSRRTATAERARVRDRKALWDSGKVKGPGDFVRAMALVRVAVVSVTSLGSMRAVTAESPCARN